MVVKETTVTFRFTDMVHMIQQPGEPCPQAVITYVRLSWTEDDGVPPEGEPSPFFDYEILGWECNLDGSVFHRQETPEPVVFPKVKEQWEFLNTLAAQIDHPGIRTAISQRLVQAIENS
jgi:hypothetical protein